MKKTKNEKIIEISISMVILVFVVLPIVANYKEYKKLQWYRQEEKRIKEANYAYNYQYYGDYNTKDINNDETSQLAISCWPQKTAEYSVTEEILWEEAECALWSKKQIMFKSGTFKYNIEGDIESIKFHINGCYDCVKTNNNTVYLNSRGPYKVKINSEILYAVAMFDIKLNWPYEYDKININISDIELHKIIGTKKYDDVANTFDISREPY